MSNEVVGLRRLRTLEEDLNARLPSLGDEAERGVNSLQQRLENEAQM